MEGHVSDTNGLAVSRDGDVVAVFGGDRPARVWDARTGNLLGETEPHRSPVAAVAFDERGARLLAASEGGELSWWSVKSGSRLRGDASGAGAASETAAFSADGRYVASYAYGDSTVRVRNVATDSGPILLGPVRRATSLALSPDGSVLVAASEEGTVRLWLVPSGDLIGVPITADSAPVQAIALSPAGDRLAVVSWDGTVRIWDVATKQQVGAKISRDIGRVTAIDFSPDGRLLATGSANSSVRLWNAADGRPAAGSPLVGHHGSVTAVRFAAGGELLVTVASDGAVRMWNPAVYLDPLAHLCALVGPPNRGEWRRFAPDEPLPEVCP